MFLIGLWLFVHGSSYYTGSRLNRITRLFLFVYFDLILINLFYD